MDSSTLDPYITSEEVIHQTLMVRPGRRALRIVAIIPAYQEANVIAQTIASLQAQTVLPSLILVAANNCTDGTEQVAYEAGATVYLVEGNRDKKAGALNRTLEMLDPVLDDADMVLVADADTQLTPDFIEVALRYHRDYTFVGGVGARSKVVRPRRLSGRSSRWSTTDISVRSSDTVPRPSCSPVPDACSSWKRCAPSSVRVKREN